LQAKETIHSAIADGWIQVETLKDGTLVNVLGTSLDAGEAEAIALAKGIAANLLVMDESAGRAVARNLDLEVTGTLGVLLKAKRAGQLPSLRDEMDRLVKVAGFFVSARVRQFFVEAAGEA
jgi:predicted nucleic acid-binding protein